MSIGVLFALSLPGVVCLLVVLAAVERLGRWGNSRAVLPWRKDSPLAGTGLEELHALLSGGKRLEVEERASRSLMRDEEGDGAPGLTDAQGRAVRIVLPGRASPSAER
jgi:hypothetical protein